MASSSRRSLLLARSAPLQDRTIGDIATRLPGAAALLRGLGIAACCCAPDRTLAAAAAAQGLPLGDLVASLHGRAELARLGAPDETSALIDHLVARYHERHRAELPGLIALAAEVEHAEAVRTDAPHGLAELLDGLRAALEEHMLKEELRVFPLMRCGRGDLLAQPLALMREEHEDNALFLLRADHLTRGFQAPPGAGPAWLRLCVALAGLVEDLAAHVFIEESVLFPRFDPAEATARDRRP